MALWMTSPSPNATLRRAVRFSWLVAALAAPLAMAQVPDCPQPAREPDTPAFYGPTRPDANTLIVFVHGGNSNSTAAFTFKGGGGKDEQFWPCLVRRDPAFANADVFLYDYDSAKRSTEAQSAEGEAGAMWNELRGYIAGTAKYAKVIFVAHSLGGLITRRMLLSHGDDEAMKGRVPFALLLGAPTGGINKEDEHLMPALIKAVSVPGHPQVKDFKTGSEFLNRLDADWPAFKSRPGRSSFYCGAEDQKTMTHLAESSTLRQCDFCVRFTDLDHHEISKPPGLDAMPHRALAEANARSGPVAPNSPPTIFTAACFH